MLGGPGRTEFKQEVGRERIQFAYSPETHYQEEEWEERDRIYPDVTACGPCRHNMDREGQASLKEQWGLDRPESSDQLTTH